VLALGLVHVVRRPEFQLLGQVIVLLVRPFQFFAQLEDELLGFFLVLEDL